MLEATEGFPTDQNDLMLYREELQDAFSGLDLTLSGLVVSDVGSLSPNTEGNN